MRYSWPLEQLAAVLHRTLTLRYRRLAATTLSRFGLSHLFRSTLSVRRLLKPLSRGPSPVKSSWRKNVKRENGGNGILLPFPSPLLHPRNWLLQETCSSIFDSFFFLSEKKLYYRSWSWIVKFSTKEDYFSKEIFQKVTNIYIWYIFSFLLSVALIVTDRIVAQLFLIGDDDGFLPQKTDYFKPPSLFLSISINLIDWVNWRLLRVKRRKKEIIVPNESRKRWQRSLIINRTWTGLITSEAGGPRRENEGY